MLMVLKAEKSRIFYFVYVVLIYGKSPFVWYAAWFLSHGAAGEQRDVRVGRAHHRADQEHKPCHSRWLGGVLRYFNMGIKSYGI